MPRKRIDHETTERVRVTLSVTEAEKTLLSGLARRFPTSYGPKGPSMAQAVTYLVRLAFQCIAHHATQEEIEPKKIGNKALKRMLEHDSASVVTLRTMEKPRIYTVNPNGSRVWDTDED